MNYVAKKVSDKGGIMHHQQPVVGQHHNGAVVASLQRHEEGGIEKEEIPGKDDVGAHVVQYAAQDLNVGRIDRGAVLHRAWKWSINVEAGQQFQFTQNPLAGILRHLAAVAAGEHRKRMTARHQARADLVAKALVAAHCVGGVKVAEDQDTHQIQL